MRLIAILGCQLMACGIMAFIMIVVVVLPELPNYKPRTAWKTDRFRPDSKGKAKFYLV